MQTVNRRVIWRECASGSWMVAVTKNTIIDDDDDDGSG